jgi:hypothetical protein
MEITQNPGLVLPTFVPISFRTLFTFRPSSLPVTPSSSVHVYIQYLFFFEFRVLKISVLIKNIIERDKIDGIYDEA